MRISTFFGDLSQGYRIPPGPSDGPGKATLLPFIFLVRL